MGTDLSIYSGYRWSARGPQSTKDTHIHTHTHSFSPSPGFCSAAGCALEQQPPCLRSAADGGVGPPHSL
eukprot:scaffold246467_cov21-Tisochrysis_lutea.AAC.1